MRFISTNVHGILDYILGILLILAPSIFDWPSGVPETAIPMALGAGIILYSLITDYERGWIPLLSVSMHLTLDLLGGLFLALSPWIFGFDERVYIPHFILGACAVAAALFTERRAHHGPPMDRKNTSATVRSY
ncbi:MAG: SPW repeat domain-containing protein [Flavobacteriales bacterium]